MGIGLHKGEPIKITLEPLGANSGIIFYRKDLGASFKAEPKNVINTQMATVIGGKEGYVSTIEHLLSAISGYGIDNVRIVLDANEVPVMDGSAISYCMMLDEAGTAELDADKKVIVIKTEPSSRPGTKYLKPTGTSMSLRPIDATTRLMRAEETRVLPTAVSAFHPGRCWNR